MFYKTEEHGLKTREHKNMFLYNKVYETHGLEFRTPYLYIELYIL